MQLLNARVDGGGEDYRNVARQALEDLAVIMGWSWTVRRVLLFTGFGFDIFFSIEFLTRLQRDYYERRDEDHDDR